jgi:drug/metabolite transporter (DMT)-like permease
VLAAVAYGLVIWAMTLAPMAQVSALRETSVIMAALIGSRLLREPFGTRRILAASVVALGVVLLQVGHAA